LPATEFRPHFGGINGSQGALTSVRGYYDSSSAFRGRP
jgi:hypothetical protein